MAMLQPGIKGEAGALVAGDNTASAYGSGGVPVFATPAMVALMEKAARLSVEPYLEPGQTTVGTRLEVRHLAATPEGLTVTARSELVAVEGKKLVFKVQASDDVELVGEGAHERYIVREDSFLKKAGAKKK
ncbi:MAG TPA: thioesterase family protein [Spirochaetia bacterium]|nr:thioesterase family protein [Spirochaetia bacterium]